MTISLLAIDLAKHVFQLHGVDHSGAVVLRKRLKRNQLLGFVQALPPCTIAMEACSSAHFWGREFTRLGQSVKLLPPQYVKPYVKTNTHDAADAEAIAEAATRPSMRTVTVKSQEPQDLQTLHRGRERVIKTKTMLLNSLRGLCAEYGIITPKGSSWLTRDLAGTRQQLEAVNSQCLTLLFERSLAEFHRIEEDEKFYTAQLERIATTHPVALRLMQIPGVGLLTATAALAVVAAPQEFKNGRHFAAFLGLVPRQHSSGGKAKLLGISKRGNSYLRRILVSGAQSILRWSPRRTDAIGRWVTALRQQKPWHLVAVALANKTARVIWHLLRYDVDYCPHGAVA
jgi:transposase